MPIMLDFLSPLVCSTYESGVGKIEILESLVPGSETLETEGLESITVSLPHLDSLLTRFRGARGLGSVVCVGLSRWVLIRCAALGATLT